MQKDPDDRRLRPLSSDANKMTTVLRSANNKKKQKTLSSPRLDRRRIRRRDNGGGASSSFVISLLLMLMLLADVGHHLPKVLFVAAEATSSKDSTSKNDNNDSSRPFAEYDNKLDFWQQRWNDHQTNWHRKNVNPMLLAMEEQWVSSSSSMTMHDKESSCRADDNTNDKGDDKAKDESSSSCVDDDNNHTQKKLSVLVPLCGKSLDVAYFADHEKVDLVVGVDGIAQPLETLAEQLALTKTPAPSNEDEDADSIPDFPQQQWRGSKAELWQGNILHLNKTNHQAFDVIYDRASLVAMPPERRQDYLNALAEVAAPRALILLIVVERIQAYDPNSGKPLGPPFSFTPDQVRALYQPQPWVESVVGPLSTPSDPGDDATKWASQAYVIQLNKDNRNSNQQQE